MIIAEGLTKQFKDFRAVDQVSFRVDPGRVLILLGPNGAGKTTTVRMLASVLRPSQGKASIYGYDVVENAEKVRSIVGVLTELHGLYGRMKSTEYLEFFAQIYGVPAPVYRKRIDELLEKFGLSHERKKRLGEYSKGMRQKLALVRSLIHDPPVLLLDEPTSAMDPESAHIVRNSIRELRTADRCIILCTHNLVEADELADMVAIIRRGRVITTDSIENLKQKTLGNRQYEVIFAEGCSHDTFACPEGVELLSRTDGKMRFRVQNPYQANPILLRTLIEKKYSVVSFQEVPQTLEEVYLKAVTQFDEGGMLHAE